MNDEETPDKFKPYDPSVDAELKDALAEGLLYNLPVIPMDPGSPLLRMVPTEMSDRNVITDRVIEDLREMTEQAAVRLAELEAFIQKANEEIAERDAEIDKLLVEAVVLREKQDRHDKVLAERDNQIAFDRMEIKRLTEMTRKWWSKK